MNLILVILLFPTRYILVPSTTDEPINIDVIPLLNFKFTLILCPIPLLLHSSNMLLTLNSDGEAPRAKLIASKKQDLPLPLGPVMHVNPEAIVSNVAKLIALKFSISTYFDVIISL